jgi:hypothetical protein
MTVTRADITKTFDTQFAKLPKLHFAMAETARHFIMLDDPQWFFQQLDAFVVNPDTVVRTRGFDR